MLQLASSFRFDIPAHENEEYVQQTKDFVRSYEEAMKGNAAVFGGRLDRGWMPPTVEDLEAEVAKGSD